ncbi:MAG: carbohydrate ABC transporter permease [Candidatus Thermoplasmatota archaeon]|nr:carbohydrate ABC transporter permease [Candidatus Thermoplasmatota archaeon]
MTEQLISARTKILIRSAIVLALLSFFAAIWLIPVYSLLINSFKTASGVISTPVLEPAGFSLSAIETVFAQMKQSLLNSLIVTIPVAAVSTFLGAMAAYHLSLKQSYFNDTVFTIIAIATFVPYEITLVPLTSLAVKLGIFNTYYGLIFAFLVFYLPTGALLMSIFMAVLPKRTLEAARIDGANDWLIFRKVVWPLVIPGAISTFMFIIVETWNNFFIPLILTSTPPMRTASVLVMSYSGSYGALYNESFAAALISSLLPLLLIIVLGRYFIRGFLALGSGGKG